MSSYIDHRHCVPDGRTGKVIVYSEHCWADFTAARIAWLYPDQDRSAQQQADVAAWNALGRRSAA